MKSKLTKKQKLLQDHNKWLASMGVSTHKPRKPKKGIYTRPDLSVDFVIPTSDTIGNGYARTSNIYSGSNDLCVGQAYNKGNYVVLSKSEASDPSTGKRRY
jgi:hypothetical protein